jgi:hypothetical protein
MQMKWGCAFTLALLLSGCIADQKKQVAACEIDAKRTYPDKTLRGTSPSVEMADFIQACMRTAGYDFTCGRDDMPLSGIYHCYRPSSKFGRWTYEIERLLKQHGFWIPAPTHIPRNGLSLSISQTDWRNPSHLIGALWPVRGRLHMTCHFSLLRFRLMEAGRGSGDWPIARKRGGIRYSHGHITILDRAALEANACECYRTRRGRIDEAFESPAV